MKLPHIIGLIIIAVVIGVLISSAGSVSEYVSFKDAREMADEGSSSKVHVVGSLKKDAKGEIQGMFYNPAMDPNYFVFTMLDQNNEEREVIYHAPKPQDLEKTEQVVVIGRFRGKDFVADQILLKCPSKYQENEVKQ